MSAPSTSNDLSGVDVELSPAKSDSEVDSEQRAKRLEWMEKQAADNIKARFATSEIIAKESQITLTVLLAGVAGAGASAAPLFTQLSNGEELTPPPLAFAAACIYLTLLSVWLVAWGMRFTRFPAAFQDPKNLLCDEAERLSWNALREEELHAVEIRIQEAAKINRDRSNRLNRIRLAACLTPVIAVLAFFVALEALPPASKPHRSAFSIECSADIPLAASGASMKLTCTQK